jgi:hypothetical protein
VPVTRPAWIDAGGQNVEWDSLFCGTESPWFDT